MTKPKWVKAPKFGVLLGRQPNLVRITPSKPYPVWCGTIVEGDNLTAQQRLAIGTRGLNPDKLEIVTVHRQADCYNEVVCPLNTPRPEYAFDCPVLSRGADGRVKVLAPRGEAKFVVEAAGRLWASKPTGLYRYGEWVRAA